MVNKRQRIARLVQQQALQGGEGVAAAAPPTPPLAKRLRSSAVRPALAAQPAVDNAPDEAKLEVDAGPVVAKKERAMAGGEEVGQTPVKTGLSATPSKNRTPVKQSTPVKRRSWCKEETSLDEKNRSFELKMKQLDVHMKKMVEHILLGNMQAFLINFEAYVRKSVELSEITSPKTRTTMITSLDDDRFVEGTCVTAVFGSKREAALAVSAASPFIAQSINKDGAQFRAVIEMPTFAAANNLVHRTDLKMRFYYFIAGCPTYLTKASRKVKIFGYGPAMTVDIFQKVASRFGTAETSDEGTFYKITFEEQTSSDHFGLWINDFPLMGTRLYCEPILS